MNSVKKLFALILSPLGEMGTNFIEYYAKHISNIYE